MRIAVIQASSQAKKNNLLYNATKKYVLESETVNFGCTEAETERYSYVEISVLIGLLLGSEAVDFVVTGCSSGQGMMLACNSMPNVLCGYAPTAKDAYLFAQINNGNAISLPLGEDYTWAGADNLEQTIQALFSEPFGQGYPKSEADRKRRDMALLKEIRRRSQVETIALLDSLDAKFVQKILTKRDVIDDILKNGKNDLPGKLRERYAEAGQQTARGAALNGRG
ncbi:MAG: RpiB/LacA/LacB family sugar-phosphate isomerase [Oscillospiraceae bacterium]|nr:RpiB/LacA/LacB family sugar-phosphate isomerase [Oscillospiraceae bacterium]